MEKYCKSCGRVFDDLSFKLCPYCGDELSTRYGRQPIPRKLRHVVFKRDGYRCRECGASKDETSLEIDHILPVAKGGTNDIDNLQTLCRECNRMKHTDEWIGGQTDLEVAENELEVLTQKLQEIKKDLKQTNDENEILDCKFMIKKLEQERIPQISDIIKKRIQENKKFEAKNKAQQKEKEKKDKLFKKLYVELEYDVIVELPNHFSINGSSTENTLRKVIEQYSEEEIYDSIPAVKRELKIKTKKRNINNKLGKIDKTILLDFCKENSININSKKEFVNYILPLSENKINEFLISVEVYNLKCMDKLELYNKYKRLKKESLILLCNHDSIEYTSAHDVAYYFTSRYNEEEILKFLKDEKAKIK